MGVLPPHRTDPVSIRTGGPQDARRGLFAKSFALDATTRILDLGAGDGSTIHEALRGTPVNPVNVYVADISLPLVRQGFERYGYKPILIGESEHLPFEDGFFDVVHCSSVIEHVTLPKSSVWDERSGFRFREGARRHQWYLAREIERVGDQHFVRTPNRFLPLDGRPWLPWLAYLPRRLQVAVLQRGRDSWTDAIRPDRSLLSARDLAGLFPASRILEERRLGLCTSLVAVHSHHPPARACRCSPDVVGLVPDPVPDPSVRPTRSFHSSAGSHA